MHSAIVHDWLVSLVGGGEKALEAIHRLFPSPVFTLVQNKKKLQNSYFQDIKVISSFIQRLPWSETKYRSYLPLFPLAIEQFDLTPFDLVISSSHCVAKGIITHPDQLHICYCYTPVRYAWDLMHEYLKEERGLKGTLARIVLHYLRGWDVHSSTRVDHFVCISRYVAKRIQKFYGREAHVIYPPVDTSLYQMRKEKEDYYLTASRFVPYKKIPLIVEAFSQMPDKKLVVIGEGPEWKKAKEKAKANIEFLGFQPDEVLKEHLQKAKAFVFAAVEDFGIIPVEAMACGTPVIAYGKGAIRETVVDRETGLFYDQQSVPSLMEAVHKFERGSFDPVRCRQRAEMFSKEQFNQQFQKFVLEKYTEFVR